MERIEELLEGLFIVACRIYDAQIVALGAEEGRALSDLHEQGKFAGSPPMVNDNPFGEPTSENAK